MTRVRFVQSTVVALGLAIAIHVDWHLARHHGRLSLGWAYHWVLAIPIFALAAWHTVRYWPRQVLAAGVASIAAAALLGQVIEPLGETLYYRLPLDQGFRAERLRAFGAFTGIGVATFTLVAWWLSRRAAAQAARGPTA